jgi:hypothetical protein
VNKLIAVFLAIGAINFCSAKADPPQLDQSRCEDQVRGAFKRLNAFAAQKHFPSLNEDPDSVHLFIGRRYDDNWETNMWRICTSSNIYVECTPTNCRPSSIFRDFLYKNAPKYDAPLKPQWTPNQAIEYAREWATAFFDGFPQSVGNPEVQFNKQMDYPKYYDGEWAVRWDRIDSQGHRFDMDALHVELNEKLGLVGIDMVFVSDFQEVKGPLIASDEAIALSRPYAGALLNSGVTETWVPPGLQLGPAQAHLWIMNPNRVLQSKTLDQHAVAFQKQARLAWVVLYQLMKGNTPASYHTLEIWIDAQTKEAIGGDFK